MVWSDGSSYEGDWDMGIAKGHGKFTHINGDFYVGSWKLNKENG
jgi:hypothetical protein